MRVLETEPVSSGSVLLAAESFLQSLLLFLQQLLFITIVYNVYMGVRAGVPHSACGGQRTAKESSSSALLSQASSRFCCAGPPGNLAFEHLNKTLLSSH